MSSFQQKLDNLDNFFWFIPTVWFNPFIVIKEIDFWVTSKIPPSFMCSWGILNWENTWRMMLYGHGTWLLFRDVILCLLEVMFKINIERPDATWSITGYSRRAYHIAGCVPTLNWMSSVNSWQSWLDIIGFCAMDFFCIYGSFVFLSLTLIFLNHLRYL